MDDVRQELDQISLLLKELIVIANGATDRDVFEYRTWEDHEEIEATINKAEDMIEILRKKH